MRERGIGIEALVLEFVEGINSEGKDLLFDLLQIVACDHGLEFDSETVGELTALGEEFEAYVCHLSILIFAIYYKIMLVCCHDVSDYQPMVWLAINSLTSFSISSSLFSTRRASLAANTTFSIPFTLVGEPASPH